MTPISVTTHEFSTKVLRRGRTKQLKRLISLIKLYFNYLYIFSPTIFGIITPHISIVSNKNSISLHRNRIWRRAAWHCHCEEDDSPTWQSHPGPSDCHGFNEASQWQRKDNYKYIYNLYMVSPTKNVRVTNHLCPHYHIFARRYTITVYRGRT